MRPLASGVRCLRESSVTPALRHWLAVERAAEVVPNLGAIGGRHDVRAVPELRGLLLSIRRTLEEHRREVDKVFLRLAFVDEQQLN